MHKYHHIIVTCLVSLLLFMAIPVGSAAPRPDPDKTPIRQAELYEKQRNYQQAADMYALTATKMDAQGAGEPWRVKAAEMSWMAGNNQQTETLIQAADESKLSPGMKARLRLLSARMARRSADYYKVLSLLNIPVDDLPSPTQKQISALTTEARAETGYDSEQLNYMINKLGNDAQPKAEKVSSIAVLLPRSGRLANLADVVIEGILHAQFKIPAESRPTVKVYDSSLADIESLYERAIAEGAQLVLGPMDKTKVDKLTATKTTAPIVTLNYGNQVGLFNPGLYQYALLPEDEAHLTAEHISSLGLNRVGVLAPDSHWGKRIAEAFRQRADGLGLEIVTTGRFNPRNQDLSSVIQKAFDIKDGQIGVEAVGVEADAIFIAATPRQGRLLKPLLKFHFLGQLPVFSTSHIYSGAEDSSADRDLDGIQYPEIPWLLKKGSIASAKEKLPTFEELNETAKNHPRLFAFGYDAFNLALHIYSKDDPNVKLSGLSGTLYVDTRNRVHRLMGWAQFERGLPVAKSLPGSF